MIMHIGLIGLVISRLEIVGMFQFFIIVSDLTPRYHLDVELFALAFLALDAASFPYSLMGLRLCTK